MSSPAVSLDDEARSELAALEEIHRRRVPRTIVGRQGPRVVVDGVEVTSFASNDYLGLAGDPRLVEAAAGAMAEYGMGVGASRLLAGNHVAHVDLEAAVEAWMECEGVRLFNTGYAANTGVLAALLREGDAVFSDELNHASIVDGCRLSRATIAIYRHRDLADLERRLKEVSGRRRIVVTESVFSMDGDVADLEGVGALCAKHGAAWIVDEAHAIGVRGPEGRGVAAERGVRPDVVIGTFGKALGTFGAFAATTRAIADLLWNRARPFVFSTGLPPAIAVATTKAISIVRGSEGDERRGRVAARARELRATLRIEAEQPEIAIVPVMVGDDQRTDEIGQALLADRMLVASVRPPTVPVGTARLRLSISADHRFEEIVRLGEMTRSVI